MDMQNERLLRLTREAAEVVCAELRQSGASCSNNMGQTPNGYQTQSDGGLFLECDGNIPVRLWTPWGRWMAWTAIMGNGDQFARTMEALKRRLGLTEYLPYRTLPDPQGTGPNREGPVYMITRVDAEELPPAVVRKQRRPADELEEEWRASH